MPGGRAAPPPATSRSCRARANVEITDAEIAAAATFEERGILCVRILALNLWTAATVQRLKVAWGVGEGALANYRRTGKVAICALQEGDLAADLRETKAAVQLQANEAEEVARRLESEKRWTTASRYRDIQRRALGDFAELAGLRQQRVSVSLEADPRLAGLWSVVWAALADADRMREAFLAEVERLTGGALPSAPLPVLSQLVREAVRRYEGELGARSSTAPGRLPG